jgi:hypothetical protein
MFTSSILNLNSIFILHFIKNLILRIHLSSTQVGSTGKWEPSWLNMKCIFDLMSMVANKP